MDARHGFLQKAASFFGPVAFNVGATRRDIQGNIHSVWTMIAHVALEFRRIFLALLWHGSLQWGSVRGYNCTQDLLSCFWSLVSWQGKCMRHGFTLRCTCIRRKLVCPFATPNLAPKTGSIFGPTICSLPYWGLVLGAAGWSGKRASQLSFFSPPFALSFGAQYLASMAAAATILCVPERLHHQRVYLLKVSLHNHNHMRSTQLLRLQAYTHNEGPRPRSQKCLVLRPQKQACWKFPSALIIICYQHSYHECKHTHTQREGPWMQGMVSCKKKPPFLDLLRSMSAQHGETYKATFTVSGPWLRMWHWNSDEYSWHYFDMEACNEVRCVDIRGVHGKVWK